ncbi:hypothetical protein [Candidatus Binatus sp.]|uniref:hypothetical protein n=1 Tax=Candidatus Binatus sp. TaxID=2811406 RepID=UPI003BAEE18D
MATSRRFFAVAVVFVVVGYVVILWNGWQLTRVDWVSLIVAVGALAYSYWLPDSERFIAEKVTKRDELLSQFAVFVLFLAFYSITAGSDSSPFNAHVRQAVALIHGHTYVDAPNYIEHAQIGPYSYQLHPMLPAILLMPFAAIWGMETNQTIFSIVFGALDVALGWRLLGRFRLTVNARTWLTVFFGAGTIVWYESIHGTSWGVSMVVAIAMTLIALDETFGEGRPAIVGTFAALAALARYDLAFVWPIYLALLFIRGRGIRELTWFIPGCVAIAVVYVAFNEIRYHSLFDRGVFIFAPAGSHLFGWEHFPGNFYTLFFMSTRLDSSFPYIHPTFGGQALILTSPAFILALRPSFRRIQTVLVGIAALIAMTPSLFYFTNGFAQYGTRHYLHTFPFLLVLMAFGVRRRADQLTRILIVVSVLMIAFGVWHERFYGLNA